MLPLKDLRVSEVAPCPCFFNLTNLFFSTLPSDYELALQEELWGCFRYIGISYDTLLKMPIQQRRFIIMKHNEEQEGITKERERQKLGANTTTVNGININDYARMEQNAKDAQKRK